MTRAILLLALAGCGTEGATTGPDAAVSTIDAGSVTGILVINEIMPSNDTACADELGEDDDWIELYNAGATELSLAGFSITDDATNPTKAILPEGVTIGAGGYLLIWADADIEGPRHLAFKLSAAGEELALYDPSGALVDSTSWATSTTDVSYARVPDGSGGFASCAAATCGASNGSACAAP